MDQGSLRLKNKTYYRRQSWTTLGRNNRTYTCVFLLAKWHSFCVDGNVMTTSYLKLECGRFKWSSEYIHAYSWQYLHFLFWASAHASFVIEFFLHNYAHHLPSPPKKNPTYSLLESGGGAITTSGIDSTRHGTWIDSWHPQLANVGSSHRCRY